jgi:hypothetical protein
VSNCRRTTPHRPRGPASREPVACAAACTSCATQIGSPPEYAPGRCMALVCGADMLELEARGWTVTTYPHDVPDVCCPHYAALCGL